MAGARLYSQETGNGLHLLNALIQWDGLYHHASSSRGQFILRAGIKTKSYHQTGGLK